MIRCQVCGYENVEGDEYCEECGVKLEAVLEGTGDGCATCGGAVEKGSAYCASCGDATAPEAIPATRDCSNCGTPVTGDDVFCPSCGLRQDGAEEDEIIPLRDPIDDDGDDGEEKVDGLPMRLRVVAGKEKDRLYEVTTGEIRIGRHGENDIVLEADGYVSGNHSRILRKGEEFFIEDLGSTNGTFIKIKKLTKIVPGDEVKIGQSIFRFEGSGRE